MSANCQPTGFYIQCKDRLLKLDLKRMNFMREKKIINNKSYFDRKRNVKVKLVYRYKDKN